MKKITELELLWVSIDTTEPLDPNCRIISVEPRAQVGDATSSSETREGQTRE